MNIEEFNKELDPYRPQLESARKLQRALDNQENELLNVIKEEFFRNSDNALQLRPGNANNSILYGRAKS